MAEINQRKWNFQFQKLSMTCKRNKHTKNVQCQTFMCECFTHTKKWAAKAMKKSCASNIRWLPVPSMSGIFFSRAIMFTIKLFLCFHWIWQLVSIVAQCMLSSNAKPLQTIWDLLSFMLHTQTESKKFPRTICIFSNGLIEFVLFNQMGLPA